MLFVGAASSEVLLKKNLILVVDAMSRHLRDARDRAPLLVG